MQRNEDCKQSERSPRPHPLTRVSVNVPTDDTGIALPLREHRRDRRDSGSRTGRLALCLSWTMQMSTLDLRGPEPSLRVRDPQAVGTQCSADAERL